MTGYAQLDQSSQPSADEIKANQITYTYNADGNLEKVSYPAKKNGMTGLSYIYDANGWLSEIKAQTGSAQETIRTYVYDAYGKVTQIKTSGISHPAAAKRYRRTIPMISLTALRR